MSATNDNSPFQVRRLWMQAEPYVNRWWLRANVRALAGSFPIGAMVGSLADVPDELPGSSDRIIDLGLAGGAAAALLLFLWWVGKKHGGVVAAIKLTALSYAFWSSLVAAAHAVWVAAGMDGAADARLIGFNVALAVSLALPSSIMLRRLDPDF